MSTSSLIPESRKELESDNTDDSNNCQSSLELRLSNCLSEEDSNKQSPSCLDSFESSKDFLKQRFFRFSTTTSPHDDSHESSSGQNSDDEESLDEDELGYEYFFPTKRPFRIFDLRV